MLSNKFCLCGVALLEVKMPVPPLAGVGIVRDSLRKGLNPVDDLVRLVHRHVRGNKEIQYAEIQYVARITSGHE